MRIYSYEKVFYIYQYLRSHKSKYGTIGSPYYIGKGTHRRFISSNRTIPKPTEKEHIVFICENMNEADAFQLEMLLIYFYGRIDKGSGCLRNKTDGGEGHSGFIQSAETKIKRSKLMMNHSVSDETKQKISEANKGNNHYLYGKHLLETTKQKMSTSRSGENHYRFGKTCSDETKRKISASKTGKQNTPA